MHRLHQHHHPRPPDPRRSHPELRMGMQTPHRRLHLLPRPQPPQRHPHPPRRHPRHQERPHRHHRHRPRNRRPHPLHRIPTPTLPQHHHNPRPQRTHPPPPPAHN